MSTLFYWDREEGPERSSAVVPPVVFERSPGTSAKRGTSSYARTRPRASTGRMTEPGVHGCSFSITAWVDESMTDIIVTAGPPGKAMQVRISPEGKVIETETSIEERKKRSVQL